MTSGNLVQILPPLRQSAVETAACPRAYVAIYIEGLGGNDSIPSERGTDIHRVMSQYVDHCASNKLASDWDKFNELTSASGPVAGPILDGIRDRYEVDWEHVYGTEVTLALDKDFNPTITTMDEHGELIVHADWAILPLDSYSQEPAAYIGTLDVVLLKEARAKINDYKSHPQPFEADTFQSMLYPFMLMRHLAHIDSVIFELDFVRYVNCRRSVKWQRSDMPAMQQEIARARERQRITHERPEQVLALPSKVCVYCPLAKDLSCPVAEWNEYTNLTVEQRLMWKVWISKMNYINNPILKAHAEVEGPIRYLDGNGKVYEYGNIPVPRITYPLDRTTLFVLEKWKESTGEDLLNGALSIRSTDIKPKLKAKKREALRQQFEDSIIMASTKPDFAVRTPDGIEKDFNPYEEE